MLPRSTWWKIHLRERTNSDRRFHGLERDQVDRCIIFLHETKWQQFELSILRIFHCHWHCKRGEKMSQKIWSERKMPRAKFTCIRDQVITFAHWFAYTIHGRYFLNICCPLGTISIQMGVRNTVNPANLLYQQMHGKIRMNHGAYAELDKSF